MTEYAYDAYGNCTIKQGANNEISRINPIRYRGYYLDRETNLYYLNARYYNPEWRRFISPANASAFNPKAVNGLNLYAYANNNPIPYVVYQSDFQPGSARAPLINSTQSTNYSFDFIAYTVSIISRIFAAYHDVVSSIFGSELRLSKGWEQSMYMINSPVFRVGISGYTTYTVGESKIIYSFVGATKDTLNILGTTSYFGVGINLFDIVGYEIQLELLGWSTQLSIGDYVFQNSTNLLGANSLMFGKTTDIGNGYTYTKGFTLGISTPYLLAAVVSLAFAIEYFLKTGNWQGIPEKIFTPI